MTLQAYFYQIIVKMEFKESDIDKFEMSADQLIAEFYAQPEPHLGTLVFANTFHKSWSQKTRFDFQSLLPFDFEFMKNGSINMHDNFWKQKDNKNYEKKQQLVIKYKTLKEYWICFAAPIARKKLTACQLRTILPDVKKRKSPFVSQNRQYTKKMPIKCQSYYDDEQKEA